MKTLAFLFLFLFSVFMLKAEQPIVAMEVQVTPLTPSNPDISDSTIFQVKMYVDLVDTSNIKGVVVFFDNQIGQQVQQTLLFANSSGSLPFTVTNNSVEITLGNFISALNYNSSVKAIRDDNSQSSPIVFNR